MQYPLLAFGVGPQEMLIIGVIAVLLFGQRLPEVGRSLGKGLSEFKKGMRGLEDEFRFSDSPSKPSRPTPRLHDIDDRDEATAPKFEPPTSSPQPEASAPADSENV